MSDKDKTPPSMLDQILETGHRLLKERNNLEDSSDKSHKDNNSTQITITLTDSEYERLSAILLQEDRKPSDILREAMNQYLKQRG